MKWRSNLDRTFFRASIVDWYNDSKGRKSNIDNDKQRCYNTLRVALAKPRTRTLSQNPIVLLSNYEQLIPNGVAANHIFCCIVAVHLPYRHLGALKPIDAFSHPFIPLPLPRPSNYPVPPWKRSNGIKETLSTHRKKYPTVDPLWYV